MNNNKIPITEDLDFAYLLELMPPLNNQPGFAWLPELFSIVGPESLINLCRYAGGETITIPTLDELTSSVEALQYFYDIHIKKTKSIQDLPLSLYDKYKVISEVYNA